MNHTTLGKTGLSVSPLCIGTWQLAGPLTFDGQPDGHPDPGKRNVLRMIGELHHRGINFIDTAEQYGGGEAERRTGEAIRANRQQWIVSTKFGYRVGPRQTRIDDSSPDTILQSLEGSLGRLGTDYIDIYLYHCAPPLDSLSEAAAILERARQAGKIRFVGISTADLTLAKALHAHGLLDVLQYPTSLLDPQTAIDEFVGDHDIGTQVRGIMAQGQLTGKYFSRPPSFAPDDSRRVRATPGQFQKYAQLQELIPEGETMAQIAVRWALSSAAHHSICLGAKSLADYVAAIEAVQRGPLPADLAAKIVAACHQLASGS